VILYMDGPGIRPGLFEMGERLASNGYYVLLPDMFWRAGPYEPLDLSQGFEKVRSTIMETFFPSTDARRQMEDTGVFLDWLARQPQAKADRIGLTGYCMGGRIALLAAGHFPDRVVAAASFHPSNLATDQADSPHLLAPKIRAKVLVAGADEDQGFPEAQKDRLAAALKEAGVEGEVSIWKGLRHGWVPPDMPVHDDAGAERHWRELTALFDETLKA
jgi:carboxymethylenebutenolidase